jgi:flagellar basal body-associated protein FliL
MPMDNVIFKATDSAIRTLTGQGGYSQPLFNEFTFKLRMINPSFSQDAGLPTLSGPVAGLGVIAVKNFLGVVPGKIPFVGGAIQPYSEQLGESIDTFALGNIGDNVDVFRAIVPASLQRIYAGLSLDEKSRQQTTAAMQAIAYNAANGRGIAPDATDEEKAEYLNNIRISAHNVLFMRHFLGLFSPVAPGTMESVGVPDYIKDTGISSLRSEFFDILNGITIANDGEITDPYEEALATYIGTKPGKLIYTVSREDKQTEVLIKNTDKLKNWGIKNAKFIKQYGEAAYIFAPQIGDFNAATYNWIQSAGLVESKGVEKYLRDVQVAEDKQKYYDIARQEKEILSTMSDPELRANVIKAATEQRSALKANNPLLNSALIGEGNTIGNEVVLMNSLEQMVANPNADINLATRRRMSLAIKMMREFIAFATDPELSNATNRTQLKAERKDQIEANLKELMLGDLYLTEANRAIFRSILNFYSRDSYYAYKELM